MVITQGQIRAINRIFKNSHLNSEKLRLQLSIMYTSIMVRKRNTSGQRYTPFVLNSTAYSMTGSWSVSRGVYGLPSRHVVYESDTLSVPKHCGLIYSTAQNLFGFFGFVGDRE